ncbi:MAG: hypothetical protein A2V86_10850 [Deltaproteobacteria bacterium RBG_16_49_23]|nr:MAG: hypothetical protein A2V86_10850 [Deltaproteobacteria bacterium RBG_16_49_23]
MVKTTDVRNSSKERDLFWEAYRGCAEENRVRPDRSPFYVRWAKDFDSFLQDKSLKDRSRKDIEAFLADLGKRPGIADWQVRQAEHALRILYEIFLPHYSRGTLGPSKFWNVDCGAFCEVIFFCISPRKLLGDFFYYLNAKVTGVKLFAYPVKRLIGSLFSHIGPLELCQRHLAMR